MSTKEIIRPDYQHSILNTITSILNYYKVKTPHKGLASLDQKLEEKYQNVVLIVLDGMGEEILNALSPKGYFKTHEIDCVTSVYPSTTTAALTTYYAGKPPIETAWIAWSQYFKEYGRNLDMLSHKDSYTGEIYSQAKINVFEKVVNYEPIFQQIEIASPTVKAYELTPSYSDKRSKRSLRVDSLEEMVENIQNLCNQKEEKFIFAYSDNPDALLHKYGTTSQEVQEYIAKVEQEIEKMLSKITEKTLVIITADHGHLNIEKEYSMWDYPAIVDCLLMPPSLESRAVTFWIKKGYEKKFEVAFNKQFKKEFLLLSKKEFLEQNYLGIGKKHPKIDEFLGDYIALSIGSSIIRLDNYLFLGKKRKQSTHCGLTKDEMLVPVITVKNKG